MAASWLARAGFVSGFRVLSGFGSGEVRSENYVRVRVTSRQHSPTRSRSTYYLELNKYLKEWMSSDSDYMDIVNGYDEAAYLNLNKATLRPHSAAASEGRRFGARALGPALRATN